jgi:hypothetical protein
MEWKKVGFVHIFRRCGYLNPLGLAPVNIYENPYLNPEPASGQFVSFILREESYGGFTIRIYDWTDTTLVKKRARRTNWRQSCRQMDL